MTHSLLFSTLSEEELFTLPGSLLSTVAQATGVSKIYFYPNLQAAFEAAFTTHEHQEGVTQHIIITRSPDKVMVAEYLERLPERTWICLIIDRLEALEVDWWQQRVSSQFMVMMIDGGDVLGSN